MQWLESAKLIYMDGSDVPILIVEYYRYASAYSYINGSAIGHWVIQLFGGSVSVRQYVVRDDTGAVFLEQNTTTGAVASPGGGSEVSFSSFLNGEFIWGQPTSIVAREWEPESHDTILAVLQRMTQ